MNRILTILSALTLLSLSISCGNSEGDKKQTQSETHAASDDMTIKTDNGEPWEANAETTDGIKKMEVVVLNFSESDSIDAYVTLKSGLEEEFKVIFEKCTMTGEAHEQLHNYLLPLKRYFNRLVAEDVEVRQQAYEDLKQHLSTYPKYFK